MGSFVIKCVYLLLCSCYLQEEVVARIYLQNFCVIFPELCDSVESVSVPRNLPSLGTRLSTSSEQTMPVVRQDLEVLQAHNRQIVPTFNPTTLPTQLPTETEDVQSIENIVFLLTVTAGCAILLATLCVIFITVQAMKRHNAKSTERQVQRSMLESQRSRRSQRRPPIVQEHLGQRSGRNSFLAFQTFGNNLNLFLKQHPRLSPEPESQGNVIQPVKMRPQKNKPRLRADSNTSKYTMFSKPFSLVRFSHYSPATPPTLARDTPAMYNLTDANLVENQESKKGRVQNWNPMFSDSSMDENSGTRLNSTAATDGYYSTSSLGGTVEPINHMVPRRQEQTRIADSLQATTGRKQSGESFSGDSLKEVL